VQNVGMNVYVSWTEGSGGIKFRASYNGGLTWNPPLNKPALTISAKGGTTQYPLMSANGSNVYVTWSQTIGSTGLQVMEATSVNNGTSFGTPVQLSSGTVSGGFITPVIASWGNNVYVGYLNASSQQSYVTCSANLGAKGSWTVPFQFGYFHEPQLAAWGGQYVYATSDASLQVSSDNCGIGASSGMVNWTNDSPFPTFIHAEPWIEASGPNVVDTWETKGSTSVVQAMYSDDYGATWSAPFNLTTALPDAWNPMLGISGNNTWIALQEYPGGANSQIFAYNSSNGGQSWSSPTWIGGKQGANTATSYPFTVSSTDGKNVFVGFSQQVNANGYWVFRVAYSPNGGASWTMQPGVNASGNSNGEAGDNNDVATGAISSFGPDCFATWQFITSSSSQIYFSTNAGKTAPSPPSMSLGTSKGNVGSSFAVAGQLFNPSSTITVKFDGTAVGTVQSSTNGSFSYSLTVPQADAGTHIVTATDGINSVSKSFTIVPKITEKPTSGAPGASVAISGTGFAAHTTITVKFNGNVVATTTSSSLGAFSTSYNVPSLANGKYTVSASDGSNSASATFTVS
jgi:hypothetical protein